jgi:hypothetical protein
VTLFPFLIAMLAWLSAFNPAPRVARGGRRGRRRVAFYGLRLTRFEATPEGFFYTPNIYVGLR